MPSSHFFLNKKKNQNGVAGHHLWGGLATPAYIYIFFFLVFSYFLGFFLFFKKKCGGGHFGNNKAKWVKLPQFETLGELSVTF
jgi:hypothetical protein